jgi:hypothetical protein
MGASLLEVLEPERREVAIQDICEILQTGVTRVGDSSKWLGYVGL